MKAFPHPPSTLQSFQYGMDLRDYFAAEIVSGMICNHPHMADEQPNKIATSAYKLADVMMEVRKKK